MNIHNEARLSIARRLQAFAQNSNRVSIMSAKAASATAWRFLLELYSWQEGPCEPLIEDIALAIDVPITLALRIVIALRDADLVKIEGKEGATSLRISLSDTGFDQVDTFLASAAAKFNEEMPSFAG